MEPIDRIEGKLDKVLDKLSEHGELLARHTTLHEKNTSDLEEHMRRSDLLETRVDELFKFKYYLVGIAAAVTTLAALAWDFLKQYIFG